MHSLIATCNKLDAPSLLTKLVAIGHVLHVSRPSSIAKINVSDLKPPPRQWSLPAWVRHAYRTLQAPLVLHLVP